MTKKILIVDDEEEIRSVICDDLQAIGWHILEASNGHEALEVLKKFEVDAVLTDVRMPKFPGFQLLQEIRAIHGHWVPVILMSAYAEIQFWDVFDAGADGYFGKPFLLSDLQDLLNRLSQPDELRWSKAIDPSDSGKRIAHLCQEDDTSASPMTWSLGRGGFFLRTSGTGLRKGQKVSFDLAMDDSQLKGVGVIRWNRMQEASDLELGLGIEFLYLTNECRQAIVERTKTLNPRPFIPKGAKP